MTRIRPQSLSGLLSAALLLIVLPLTVALVYGGVQLRQLSRTSDVLVRDSIQRTQETQRLLRYIYAMERSADTYSVLDDPRIAASLRRALIYEGYGVEVATDGPSALAASREGTPDLVVLDVMLPGLDGVEVCRRLRAGGDVAILMLTARDATADRVLGLDSGADDYLTKPFAYEELLARVRALLRRRQPRPDQTLRYGDLTLDPGGREQQVILDRVSVHGTLLPRQP